jgi:phage tail-like protein
VQRGDPFDLGDEGVTLVTQSSYTAYLPPVLWVDENDRDRLLARALSVFERILTGIPLRAEVVRAEGARLSAAGNQVIMASPADAGRFRAGDSVLVAAGAPVRTVQQVDTVALVLDAAVPTLGAGTVRIADLAATQTRLRLDNVAHVGPGSPLRITQGAVSVEATVASVTDDVATLATGLGASFAMTAAAMPVVVTDGTTLQLGGRDYPDIETTIDGLSDVFNPWRTRAGLLPWLASWVGLTLRADWTDFQRRWLTEQIASIYRQRGLKQGLLTYLDIYAPSAARPRLAVDDGDAILRLHPEPAGGYALREVAHSATVARPGVGVAVTVLLHPSAIAFDAANRYLVADQGDISLSPIQPARLWRMSRTGEVPFGPGPPAAPMPQPVHSGAPLAVPTAMTVDATDRIAVVDVGSTNIVNAGDQFSRIVRFAPPVYAPTIVIGQGTTPVLPVVNPVDMVLDVQGRFIVLDRGLHRFGDPPAGASNPRIVVVSEGPLTTTVVGLPGVTEPTALAIDGAGRYIVADARDQTTTTPADLVRVDPAAGFAQTSLLAGLPAASNPLIYPIGLAFDAAGRLLVCDTGVRMGYVGDTQNRTMAESAAIYRVDLSQTPALITRVVADRRLVMPSDFAVDREGAPIVLDRGETLRGPPTRSWRTRAHEFGVVLLFSAQRPTTFDERNVVRRGVFDVVNEQKPAHTTWWMDI